MIHHVFACKSNIGDWLSARGIQSLVSPERVTEYLCDEPFVEATLERLRAVAPNELIIIGGGGLFMAYFAPFWEGLSRIAHRVSFGLWGVGFCDLKRELTRAPEALLRNMVSRSRFCFVRDELTRNYLAAPELPSPVPCPAMAAIEWSDRQGQGVLHASHYGDVGPKAYEVMSSVITDFSRRTGRACGETDNQI